MDIQKLRTSDKDLLAIEKLLETIAKEATITADMPLIVKKKLWNITHNANVAQSYLFDYCCNAQQFGWHPASELPPVNTEIVIWTEVHSPQFENAPVGYVPILGRLINGKWPSNIIVKRWCYPPKGD